MRFVYTFRKMRSAIARLPFLFLFSFTLNLLPAQNPAAGWPDKFYKGYTKSIKGGNFTYHSPDPEVSTSLLVRSDDKNFYIEWESEPVKPVISDAFVNLAWMFAIDANPEQHVFYLTVNGKPCISFTNPVVSAMGMRAVEGPGGASLTFQTTFTDKHNDPMGYAILRVPVASIIGGEAQVIRITGENAGSRVWYMTYETPVSERLKIIQDEALLRGETGLQSCVKFQFVHLGAPVNASITVKPGINKTFTLLPGYNAVEVRLPEATKDKNYSASITIGDKAPEVKKFVVKPVRHRTIYFVQHSHTDIGYTRPQTEILAEHLRYIDFALDYCDQTDNLPDDAKFRWTCETTFAVREYMRCRPPQQIERLKKRIQEGRIEVTGMFLNLSDLADEATLAEQLKPVSEFNRMGINVCTAMQDDVNGIGWCLADYLPSAGIKYLTMGQNVTRALEPFTIPTAFWWESPSGSRILAFRAEHYQKGNDFGILNGQVDAFGKELFRYIGQLHSKGYPFDQIALQFSGYITDNSPPSTSACNLVKDWNEQYVWPRIRLATVHEFPEYVSEHYADKLQAIRGAWPDWWMDGFGSAALETSYSRQAHTDFIATQGLLSMALLMGAKPTAPLTPKLEAISDNLIFYDEHTFGAAESVSDPLCENSVVQWGQKSAYTWDAVKKNRLLREEAMGLLQPYLQRNDIPSLVVFNTLNWTRSAVVSVYIDHQVLPLGRAFRLEDENGALTLMQQMDSREDGTYWAVYARDIPALGYKTFRLKVSKDNASPYPNSRCIGTLENLYYRLTLDTINGSIKSLYDKALGRELADVNAQYSIGQVIYERLGNNRQQIEQLKLDEYTRTTWKNIKVGKITEGPIWTSILLNGTVAGCNDASGINCELRLFKTEKRLEMLYSMKKLAVTDPEGVYIAFPFNLSKSHLVWEANGGEVVPGKDQVPGSASDYDGIQNYAAVRSDSAQIVWVSNEIPLAMMGGLNLGKFMRVAKPETTSIFSWVLNNYWFTNFRASQEGELRWTYQLTSGAVNTQNFAVKFGWGSRVPLLTRMIPAGLPGIQPASRSFPGDELNNIVMIRAAPSTDGKGIMLQLRETSGKETTPDFSTLMKSAPAATLIETSALELPLKAIGPRVTFKPYEVKFLKMVFGE